MGQEKIKESKGIIVMMTNHIKGNFQEKQNSIKITKMRKSKEVKSLVRKKGGEIVLKRTIINTGVKQTSGMKRKMKIPTMITTIIIILMKKFIMLKDIIMMNQAKINTKKEEKEGFQKQRMIRIGLIWINVIK